MEIRYRTLRSNPVSAALLCLVGLILLALLLASSHVGSPVAAAPNPLAQSSQEDSRPSGTGTDEEIRPATQAAGVVHLFWHEAVGGPAFLDPKGVKLSSLGLSEKEARVPVRVAQAFLENYGDKLQISKPASKWRPIRTEVDRTGDHHVFLEQTYDGLRVFAAQLAIHIGKDVVYAINGEYLSEIGVATKPVLSVDAAYKVASSNLDLDIPVLVSGELLIYNPALLDAGPSANHLAYHLIVGDEHSPALQTVFVDAHTGKLLLSYNNLETGKNRDIRDLNGSETLPGSQCYTESGPVGSPSADCLSAFNFSGNIYDYYLNTHGRDSFNGSGATMLASVRYGTEANALLGRAADRLRSWLRHQGCDGPRVDPRRHTIHSRPGIYLPIRCAE